MFLKHPRHPRCSITLITCVTFGDLSGSQAWLRLWKWRIHTKQGPLYAARAEEGEQYEREEHVPPQYA